MLCFLKIGMGAVPLPERDDPKSCVKNFNEEKPAISREVKREKFIQGAPNGAPMNGTRSTPGGRRCQRPLAS